MRAVNHKEAYNKEDEQKVMGKRRKWQRESAASSFASRRERLTVEKDCRKLSGAKAAEDEVPGLQATASDQHA